MAQRLWWVKGTFSSRTSTTRASTPCPRTCPTSSSDWAWDPAPTRYSSATGRPSCPKAPSPWPRSAPRPSLSRPGAVFPPRAPSREEVGHWIRKSGHHVFTVERISQPKGTRRLRVPRVPHIDLLPPGPDDPHQPDPRPKVPLNLGRHPWTPLIRGGHFHDEVRSDRPGFRILG